ncbi:Glucose-responsive transcription factor [Neocucurbitaria cava]|uniref:Glucose-responsive transcription factor n=1 Tax=Neocucurbitaria cava TaxID=798079 RepID=A0A9W8Y9C7_9PLEO|nr:Glucose-responsive transcription factor [Neocucurbitaria cava]
MQCNLSFLVMQCKVLSGRPERTVEEVFPNSDYTITNALEHLEQQASVAVAARSNMSNYADPDAQMGAGPGPYGNQNGTPPSQQQQHMTDPELRLQENLQQLREGGDMAHANGPQQPQYQQLAQMAPNMSAHQHFQTPLRPTHSPQQMAHAVMSLEGHHDAYDPNDPSRKRSKVSRACDECRRKKVGTLILRPSFSAYRK